MTENVRLVEALLATVGQNDVEAATAMCAPHLEFVDILAPMEETVREVQGREGMRAWFAGLYEGGHTVSAAPSDLKDLGNGRVFGTVHVVRVGPRDEFSLEVYGIWEIRDALFTRIQSYFDPDLARIDAGLPGTGPLESRRWVEGVVSAKLVTKRAVLLRSPEHPGREFSVRGDDLWHELEVGGFGIAETDSGELLSWRTIAR